MKIRINLLDISYIEWSTWAGAFCNRVPTTITVDFTVLTKEGLVMNGYINFPYPVAPKSLAEAEEKITNILKNMANGLEVQE